MTPKEREAKKPHKRKQDENKAEKIFIGFRPMAEMGLKKKTITPSKVDGAHTSYFVKKTADQSISERPLVPVQLRLHRTSKTWAEDESQGEEDICPTAMSASPIEALSSRRRLSKRSPKPQILETTDPKLATSLKKERLEWKLNICKNKIEKLESDLQDFESSASEQEHHESFEYKRGRSTSALRTKLVQETNDDSDEAYPTDSFAAEKEIQHPPFICGDSESEPSTEFGSDDSEYDPKEKSDSGISTRSDTSNAANTPLEVRLGVPIRDTWAKLSKGDLLKLCYKLYGVASELCPAAGSIATMICQEFSSDEEGILPQNDVSNLRKTKCVRSKGDRPFIALDAVQAEFLRNAISKLQAEKHDLRIELAAQHPWTPAMNSINEDNALRNATMAMSAMEEEAEGKRDQKKRYPVFDGPPAQPPHPLLHQEVQIALIEKVSKMLEREIGDDIKVADPFEYHPNDLKCFVLPNFPAFGRKKPSHTGQKTAGWYKEHFHRLMVNFRTWVEAYFMPSDDLSIPIDKFEGNAAVFNELVEGTEYFSKSDFIVSDAQLKTDGRLNKNKRRKARIEAMTTVFYSQVYAEIFESWIMCLDDDTCQTIRFHLGLKLEEMWSPEGIRKRSEHVVNKIRAEELGYDAMMFNQREGLYYRLQAIFQPLQQCSTKPNLSIFEERCRNRQLMLILAECQSLTLQLQSEPVLYRITWPLQTMWFDPKYMHDVTDETSTTYHVTGTQEIDHNKLVDIAIMPGLWRSQKVQSESKEATFRMIDEALCYTKVACKYEIQSAYYRFRS